MTLTQTTNHVTAAKELLIEQYRGEAVIEGLLDALTPQIQILEDASFDMLTKRWLDSATGVQLDVLGRIVGQPRNGMDDTTYLLWLRAHIRINIGSGTPEDLLTIFNLISPNIVSLQEWFPAGLTMVAADELDNAAAIAAILHTARPAGVGASLEYTLTDDDGTFTFAAGDSEESDAARGFADDGATTGGDFADALEI